MLVQPPRALAVDLDRVLADTRGLWAAFVADAARRFASIAPLDPAALPRDRSAAAAALDRWAAQGVGDWRRALSRFAEERAPVYVRPNAAVNAALRALAATGWRVGVFTDAPAPLARVVLAHLGLEGRVAVVETGPRADERVLTRLGDRVEVVVSSEQLVALASSSRARDDAGEAAKIREGA